MENRRKSAAPESIGLKPRYKRLAYWSAQHLLLSLACRRALSRPREAACGHAEPPELRQVSGEASPCGAQSDGRKARRRKRASSHHVHFTARPEIRSPAACRHLAKSAIVARNAPAHAEAHGRLADGGPSASGPPATGLRITMKALSIAPLLRRIR